MFIMRSKIIYIMLWDILVWIGIGALAGYLGGLIVKGRGKGFLLNLLVGIVGGVIGGFLLGGKISLADNAYVNHAIVATGGATVLLFLIKLIFKR